VHYPLGHILGQTDSWLNTAFTVRREKALVHSGRKVPPGNWIVPPGR